jgi:hypothetical protein
MRFRAIIFNLFAIVVGVFFVGVTSVLADNQYIYLNPGWNIVSTPKVVESHSFSAPETSDNFDIFVLDASNIAGWSTMAGLGQTEFTPLYGYFINNKTSSTQLLTFNYKENLNPNQRLFERKFTKVGWYSIGVANPTYAKKQYGGTNDTNNVSNILDSLNGYHSTVIDFTEENFLSSPSSVHVGNVWKAVVPGDLNSLRDLRETKGYAIYITKENALYNGFQNNTISTSHSQDSFSLIFNKSSDSPTAAVVPGAQSVELAKFYAKPVGESMELRKVSFYIQQGGTTPLTGTVYVKVNGSIVYSAAASGISTTTPIEVTLSSYPVLYDVDNYITVEASISSNAGSSDSYQVKAFDLTQVKRLVTNDIFDPGVGAVDGNSIAVKAAALAVTTLSQPVSSSVVVGTSQHEFARFELNAQSGGEDVKVKKIVVTDTKSGGASYSDIANLQMYLNGQPLTTTGSTATNGATVTFTFSSPIEVKRDAPVVLSLKADVVGGTAGQTHKYHIAGIGDVEAVGAKTGNNVTPTVSGNGQTMTIASGSLALSLVTGSGASPSVSQLVTIGSTNVPVFAFKLTSQYEAQKVYELKLTWDGTSLNSDDVVNLRLYKDNDPTPFATASQGSCSSNTCTYTFTWADNWGAGAVQPGSPMTVYVKADIGGQGAAKLGDNFKFKIASSTADIKAKGAVSGSNSSVTGTPTVTAVTYIAPFSVVVSGETPSAGSSVTQTVTSGTVIGRFKVQNNGSAQIRLTHVKFTDNGTNSTTTETYKLWYSDENSSNYTANVGGTSTSTDFGALGTPITLNGGSYRYLTVTVENATGLASGDSFNLAVASLGDLKYSVDDADLGYDGNRDGNSSSGISAGLYVDGKPVLGTIVKQ